MAHIARGWDRALRTVAHIARGWDRALRTVAHIARGWDCALPSVAHIAPHSEPDPVMAAALHVTGRRTLASFALSRLVRVERGERGTPAHRIFLSLSGRAWAGADAGAGSDARLISFWHDVPLKSIRSMVHAPIFHYVNEIPRGTTAKNEIAGQEEHNPIRQDRKNGQLRFLKHGPVLHNYGCLPQTWEDPSVRQTPEQLPGDNDPVDVLEIGDRALEAGEVVEVRLLGAMALVDENECDWKLLAINLADPKAATLHDIGDVPVGVVDAVREWYRVYKVAEGKPPNRFAYNGQAFGKDFARSVAEECHTMWRSMRRTEADDAANERL